MRFRHLFVGFLMLFSVLGFLLYHSMFRRPTTYIIPCGYTGWVTARYNVPTAPPLPVEEGYYTIKLPASGRIDTSSQVENGFGKDRFFYRCPGGHRILQPSAPNGGGQVWGGGISVQTGTSVIKQRYFIGSESSFNNSTSHS